MIKSHPCGQRKRGKEHNTLISRTIEELRSELQSTQRKRRAPVFGVQKMKRRHLCVAVSPIISSNLLNTLPYDQNSCYLDTILVSLFHFYSTWATKHIWLCNIKNIHRTIKGNRDGNKLRLIAQDIHDALECILFPINLKNNNSAILNNATLNNEHFDQKRKLRKLFADFDKEYMRAYGINWHGDDIIQWQDAQNDPCDLIDLLYRVFDIPADVPIKITFNGSSNLATIHSTIITLEHLKKAKNDNVALDIADHVPTTDAFTIKRANMIYVKVMRIDRLFNKDNPDNYTDNKVSTKIRLHDVLKIGRTKLRLMSIVIHKGDAYGGHYTCFVRQHATLGGWLYFDDMVSSVRLIAKNIIELLEMPGVMENIVGCVFAR